MRNILALLVIVSALGFAAGCGPKDESMDASPVANQTPKTPPAPKVNKPIKFSSGTTSDEGAAAPTPQ